MSKIKAFDEIKKRVANIENELKFAVEVLWNKCMMMARIVLKS
jgi:hypothetical protein